MSDMEKMTACGTWITLKMEKPREMTDTGIFLASDPANEKIKCCEVLSVGAGVKIAIKAGNKAYIPAQLIKGVSVEQMDGSWLVVTDETHIIGYADGNT